MSPLDCKVTAIKSEISLTRTPDGGPLSVSPSPMEEAGIPKIRYSVVGFKLLYQVQVSHPTVDKQENAA